MFARIIKSFSLQNSFHTDKNFSSTSKHLLLQKKTSTITPGIINNNTFRAEQWSNLFHIILYTSDCFFIYTLCVVEIIYVLTRVEEFAEAEYLALFQLRVILLIQAFNSRFVLFFWLQLATQSFVMNMFTHFVATMIGLSVDVNKNWIDHRFMKQQFRWNLTPRNLPTTIKFVLKTLLKMRNNTTQQIPSLLSFKKNNIFFILLGAQFECFICYLYLVWWIIF